MCISEFQKNKGFHIGCRETADVFEHVVSDGKVLELREIELRQGPVDFVVAN